MKIWRRWKLSLHSTEAEQGLQSSCRQVLAQPRTPGCPISPLPCPPPLSSLSLLGAAGAGIPPGAVQAVCIAVSGAWGAVPELGRAQGLPGFPPSRA